MNILKWQKIFHDHVTIYFFKTWKLFSYKMWTPQFLENDGVILSWMYFCSRFLGSSGLLWYETLYNALRGLQAPHEYLMPYFCNEKVFIAI